MAEIPEHLLARSKARRAQLSGEAPADAPSGAPAPAAAASAATPAVAAPAAAKVAKAEPAIPTAVPTPPPVKGLMFSKIGAVFLMVGVPVWSFFYAGIFATPKSTKETPQQAGARLYNAQCSSCHLANGAGKDEGGVGRALWKGEAEKTFVKLEEQIAFVRHGSCAAGVAYGNPNREGGEHKALGGMPAFPDLTDTQIWEIITYERTVLSEQEWPALTEEEAAEGFYTIPTSIPAATEDVCRP
jgi:mono/diheme cytochrome c family protein